ncbi:L-aspartate oxidase [Patescibacteria group bacterium]|nr:L-aspartate oxidase [Patescibacteria group bacterium]MBU1500370.1 L-aspartate oxidase [Patescibacteria group bacterium]
MKEKYQNIIIGSGLAGLTCALTLEKSGSVLLISKSRLVDCATNLAQGGIAAAMTDEDSFSSHIQDTLVAGGFHNNQRMVKIMVREAPEAIKWLQQQGVIFDKNPGLEAAHSYRRIMRISDFSGRAVEKALLKKIKQNKNIKVLENCFVIDLVVENKKCIGVKTSKNIYGGKIILATGGLGQIFSYTTNPKVATGDGLAMAYRAGCQVVDLEFIQFHPTALKDKSSPLFLLSESLRGEGAYLVNTKGKRFISELAPRDILARAIVKEQGNGEVYLDIRHRREKFIKKRFPNIYRELKKRGFNLAGEKIPITPAAHYSCGGVKVDSYGRTNIKNLFAFGEVACTGVHGANRLASNSLLEAVVFPRRLAQL